MIYPNDLPVEQAREIYFSRSGFTAETYNAKWIKLPFLGRHFYLLNFSARKKAVPLHDIDHILTEYNTDWQGEWQISAFEIATGCGKYWAGWMINLQGIVMGALCYPRVSLRAFARGRRSRGVYGFKTHEPLLKMRVGDLRKNLNILPGPVEVAWPDFILFYMYVLFSLVINFGIPAVIIKLLFFKTPQT